MVLLIKNPHANEEDVRDMESVSGLVRSPGGGNGKPLQYSCLQNPVDRVAWQDTAHGVAKSEIQLK